MVSVNSSSNAWNNWQTRNVPPPSDTAPAPTTTTTSTGGDTGAPTGAADPIASQIVITDASAPALIYSAPTATRLGQTAVNSAQSLSNKLDQQGFFTPSATADQEEPSAPPQLAPAAMPEALTQAEVIARAAYTIVSEAGASNPAASLMEQFG